MSAASSSPKLRNFLKPQKPLPNQPSQQHSSSRAYLLGKEDLEPTLVEEIEHASSRISRVQMILERVSKDMEGCKVRVKEQVKEEMARLRQETRGMIEEQMLFLEEVHTQTGVERRHTEEQVE